MRIFAELEYIMWPYFESIILLSSKTKVGYLGIYTANRLRLRFELTQRYVDYNGNAVPNVFHLF